MTITKSDIEALKIEKIQEQMNRKSNLLRLFVDKLKEIELNVGDELIITFQIIQ